MHDLWCKIELLDEACREKFNNWVVQKIKVRVSNTSCLHTYVSKIANIFKRKLLKDSPLSNNEEQNTNE